MKKFNVFMRVVGTTCVEVEASNEKEAMEKAYEEYGESTASICHQCSDEISEPTITEALEAVEVAK